MDEGRTQAVHDAADTLAEIVRGLDHESDVAEIPTVDQLQRLFAAGDKVPELHHLLCELVALFDQQYSDSEGVVTGVHWVGKLPGAEPEE